MGNKRVMIQLKPEANQALREIPESVEKNGGRVLPAPLIFPPVLHFSCSEAQWAELKQKYGTSILRTMAEEAEEE